MRNFCLFSFVVVSLLCLVSKSVEIFLRRRFIPYSKHGLFQWILDIALQIQNHAPSYCKGLAWPAAGVVVPISIFSILSLSSGIKHHTHLHLSFCLSLIILYEMFLGSKGTFFPFFSPFLKAFYLLELPLIRNSVKVIKILLLHIGIQASRVSWKTRDLKHR